MIIIEKNVAIVNAITSRKCISSTHNNYVASLTKIFHIYMTKVPRQVRLTAKENDRKSCNITV